MRMSIPADVYFLLSGMGCVCEIPVSGNGKNLSTAKSPQQMFGAVAKSYYAQILDVDPSRIFSVSIMPCVAKKHECAIPVMNDAGAGQDVDISLTTRELDRVLKAELISPLSWKKKNLTSRWVLVPARL